MSGALGAEALRQDREFRIERREVAKVASLQSEAAVIDCRDSANATPFDFENVVGRVERFFNNCGEHGAKLGRLPGLQRDRGFGR